MPIIVIQGTPINFPDTAQSPDWSEAVIAFAQAVENALSASAGAFDVSPQVFNIDGSSFNPTATLVDIPNLTFSTTAVRAAMINIATSRSTNSTVVSEVSSILAIYNSSNAIGSKWELTREADSNANITFSMTDIGQMQFSTLAISGTNHTGIISYSAKALLNS
jgi:hypothetical protein